MGIIDTLRNRIENGCKSDYVVVNDDEIDELLTALDGMTSLASDGMGNLVPPDCTESHFGHVAEVQPIFVFGRKVVAPGGS